MHGRARIVWNHCAGFDSGILLVQWIRNKRQLIRLNLAQGIALALEFKMGGEVLRTVVVREWSELGILGAIICPSGNAYIFDSLGDQERKKRHPGRARRKARVKRGTKKGVCRMSGLPFSWLNKINAKIICRRNECVPEFASGS